MMAEDSKLKQNDLDKLGKPVPGNVNETKNRRKIIRFEKSWRLSSGVTRRYQILKLL